MLLCIRRAGEICVTDLAAAAQVRDTTVSQALRLLRAHGIVAPRRARRIVYYRLTDTSIRDALDLLERSIPDASAPGRIARWRAHAAPLPGTRDSDPGRGHHETGHHHTESPRTAQAAGDSASPDGALTRPLPP